MKKYILAVVLFVCVGNTSAKDDDFEIWQIVDPIQAESIFEFMKSRIGAPQVLPMPEIYQATLQNRDAIMQYYNVGRTYGTNMPWIHYSKRVKQEPRDMATFYLSHEFAHYLLHAKQNGFMYPRAGNQYWDQVEFNHHCNREFIKLLDDVVDYMQANNMTKRSAKMKGNTRYNCEVAGHQ